MKLQEITGYKRHPINQMAQQLQAAGNFDKVFSSYDPVTMEKLTQLLKQYGWDQVGFGYYATVYEHPRYPYVVKIFVNDTAYAEYFTIMKENQGNPHVPKIRGNFMHVGDVGFAVRLEKLEQVHNIRDPVFAQYIAPGLPRTMHTIIREDNEPFLQENWPQLLSLIQQIKAVDFAHMDWASRNVMTRGTTLVITDPISL